jgi:rfaE bifunctional protein nucleotidyltransferase chain/domain
MMNEPFSSKVLSIQDLVEVVEKYRQQKKRLVFTNGCFDILHRGHTDYLAQAKKLGDILIVGVNSDESVRSIKGEKRPINSLEDRLAVLSALAAIDYLVVFNEELPIELIKLIRPNVHVKGGDYRAEDLPETATVKECGGEVQIISTVVGKSTTELIHRLLKVYGKEKNVEAKSLT